MSSIEDVIRLAVREVVREELRPLLERLAGGGAAAPSAGYLTVDEAAERAKVHRNTVLAWIRDGSLPRHRAGKGYRIHPEELRKLIETPRGGCTLDPKLAALQFLKQHG